MPETLKLNITFFPGSFSATDSSPDGSIFGAESSTGLLFCQEVLIKKLKKAFIQTNYELDVLSRGFSFL